MTPGWKTSEFWMTALMQLVGLLVAVGVVALGDKATLEKAISDAVTSIGGLAVAGTSLWRYIESRRAAKKDEMAAVQAVAIANVEAKVDVAKNEIAADASKEVLMAYSNAKEELAAIRTKMAEKEGVA